MNKAILVVSFGTSYNESRSRTIEAIEQALKVEFPEYKIRRAFTSQVIIDILRKRDGIEIDGVERALEKLVEEGVTHVIIQPTLVMGGEEHDRILDAVKKYESQFMKVRLGEPLLTSENDYMELTSILVEDTREYDLDGTEILFMGHGTEHAANITYSDLDKILKKNGYSRYHVGTVEAEPSFDEVKKELDQRQSKRVLLQPLMIVSGDHAHNDMAGNGHDSWKSQLEADGYKVICRLKGMGELEGVQRMFVEHTKAAKTKLEDKE